MDEDVAAATEERGPVVLGVDHAEGPDETVTEIA